jgi:muramoyltetrapeptide carboxypeptidase
MFKTRLLKQSSMIKPKALTQNSTIGIVSPSYWLDEKILRKTAKFFTDLGYNIEIGKSNSLQWGPFAGTPQQRADDLHRMFNNPNIDAVMCARGGYGANRVLPLLDYELIQNNPKIFIGYSDITAYLTSITQQTGLVTFHGPMLTTYKKSWVNYNYNLMKRVLTGEKHINIEKPESLETRILKDGIASGPIWGGNISLLINRLGTADALNTEGIILFLEDIDEYLYSFERMLVQMRAAGMFDKISGLIIGELEDIKDQEIKFNRNTDEIILDICGDLDIPILSNFPCGHGKYQTTLPISITTEIDTSKKDAAITIIDNAVTPGD